MGIHGRAFPSGILKAIADRILDLERHKIQALQRASVRAHLHFDALLRGKPILPADGVRRAVHIVFIAIGSFRNPQEDAAGDAALQIHPITKGEGAAKGHASGRGLDAGGAQVGEFVGEDRFESAGAGCKKSRELCYPFLSFSRRDREPQ